MLCLSILVVCYDKVIALLVFDILYLTDTHDRVREYIEATLQK